MIRRAQRNVTNEMALSTKLMHLCVVLQLFDGVPGVIRSMPPNLRLALHSQAVHEETPYVLLAVHTSELLSAPLQW